MSDPIRVDLRPSWFGQPRGLTILFLTEMWEQFSYYGMRALLVYYMTRQLMIGQEKASLIYGAYTATSFLTPIFGGIIADRWLGNRRAVIIGGTIMAIGHFLMTFDSLLYLALATIALGNGLFLPSLPSQINDLYEPRDSRRARAYNIYYVGINLGGFLAPLVCGTLGEFYGWPWGFAAAGVGMFVGLIVYICGSRYLPTPKRPETQRAPVPANSKGTLLLLVGIGIAVTVFRAAYEQVGNTVALWAQTGVDRHVGSTVIPMTWFQALNPLLVFLMTPLLLARWKKQTEPSSMRKMAAGAMIVALAYCLLAGVAAWAGPGTASWIWLAGFFVVYTWGELHILPTGLGLFARLAPAGFAATTVAAWFLATFSGSLAAGVVGTSWSIVDHARFFAILAALAAVAAGMLLSMDRSIRRIETERASDLAPTS